MKRRIQLFVIFIVLMLSTAFPMSLGSVNNFDTKDQQIKITNDGNILYVGGSGPGNYSSIQEALNDADDGDTIYSCGFSSAGLTHNVFQTT